MTDDAVKSALQEKVSFHAQLRSKGRMSELDADRILSRAEQIADKIPQGSAGVILYDIPFQGNAWSDVSNGDTVVAIVRDGSVITLMFRRGTQPMTPSALRVDRVYDARKMVDRP